MTETEETVAVAAEDAPASARKVSGWFWVRAALAAGILAVVISRNGGTRIFRAMGEADPVWVGLAALSFLVSIALGAYQWFLLLRMQDVGYTYRQSFRTYYAGLFLNNFLPTTVGGDALRVYEVKRSTDLLGRALTATFLDRLFGFFALSVFALVAAGLMRWSIAAHEKTFLTILNGVSVIFLAFFVGLVILLSRRVSSAVHRLLGRLKLGWLESAYQRVQGFSSAYHERRGALLLVLALSCLIQILRINVHWFSAVGLGIPVSPVYFFCFIPIVALAGIIPMNIGGWGIPQSLGTFLYTLPGVIAVGLLPGSEVKVMAASLAFLPSAIGLFVMLFGGFYFIANAKPTGSPTR